MAAYSLINLTRDVLRLINLLWYLTLSPFFVAYLLLHASGLKSKLLIGYDHLCDWVATRLVHSKTTDQVASTTAVVGNKQALDKLAGSGSLPLTICLGLCYVPFYFYTMICSTTYHFLLWNIPLMYIFALVCCDDTHYDSHYWMLKRHQSVWYRHLISGRFKQYTQMIWFPLAQHLPHLHIHHKFNMKNQKDIDYNGCYQRDEIRDFLRYLSIYEWNYNWNSLRYFYALSGSRSLLRTYIKDLLLNYGLLAFAACFGWQKFAFQYACHCLCYCFIAWVTFYVEHPFHHKIDDSYEHFWNALTIVNSATGLSSESHTSHHVWPAKSPEQNANWANDPIEFASSQLKYRHLAIAINDSCQELLQVPYLIINKQYGRLAQMLHFKSIDQLEAAGMDSDLIDAYKVFRNQCDGTEIQHRLRRR